MVPTSATTTTITTTTTTITTTISPQVTPAVAAAAQPLPPVPPRSPARDAQAANLDQAVQELWTIITPAVAQRTLLRLALGYPKERTTPAVPAATTNTKGCWIASLTPTNAGGHCALRPNFPRKGTKVPKGAPKERRRSSQYTHRMAIVAWKPREVLELLLFRDGRPQSTDASHLCHTPACFNPNHLTVESHGANEQRKARCHRFGRCQCGLTPKCIF